MASASRAELMKAAGDYLRGLVAFDDLYVLAVALAPKLVRDPLAANLAGQIILAKVDGLSPVEIHSVIRHLLVDNG